MKIRFIGYSPKDGSLNEEQILFTDDFQSSDNVLFWQYNPDTKGARNLKAYEDKIVEMDLICTFPINRLFIHK